MNQSYTRPPHRRQAYDPDPSRVVQLPTADLHPAPENDDLYGRTTDAKVADLLPSVRESGILEPLRVSRDGTIISGHRRHRAAVVLGLATVPAVVADITYADLTRAGRLALLRDPNRQRAKSFAEQVREAAVDADPDAAYACLTAERQRRLDAGRDVAMTLRPERKRPTISKAKQPMLGAIQRIVEDRRDYWPISVRSVHYALCNVAPLRHASKPDSVYLNDDASYGACKELLHRARLAGDVPMEAVDDETRVSREWGVHPTPQDFARRQMRDLFNNYARDLLQSQPDHVELVAEKNTILPVVEPLASEYCVPLTSARGYPSLPAIQKIVARYERSGKDRLVLLLVTDADPEGYDIAHSLGRNVRDDFGIAGVETRKIALTMEQVAARHLPPNLKAKVTSSRYKRFVRDHGTTNVYELEALDPADLAAVVRDGIHAALDLDAYNREARAERDDAGRLAALRRAAIGQIGDAAGALEGNNGEADHE